MTKFWIGDVVNVSRSRKGTFDGVIVRTRFITRGKHKGKAEFTIAPMKEPPIGREFYMRLVDSTNNPSMLRESSRKYTEAEIEIAMARQSAVQYTRVTNKHERIEANLKKVDTHDLKPGDKVLVEYRDIGGRWELVERVNHRTGRVGLKRRGSMVMVRKVKQRWLDPRHIVKVLKPGEDGYDDTFIP